MPGRRLADSRSKQRQGAGAALVGEMEQLLSDKGNRMLIANTSGTDPFRKAREFLKRNGYLDEAGIRNCWATGASNVRNSLCSGFPGGSPIVGGVDSRRFRLATA